MTNKELLSNLTHEVLNKGNRAMFDELVAPDAVCTFTDAEKQRGPALWSEWIGPVRKAFPDLEVKVEDTVTEGDLIAIRWSASGTHQGELFGRAPTNKRINTFGIHFGHVKNGRVVDLWVKFSRMQVLTQLGLS